MHYINMHELGVQNFYIELMGNYPCNGVYELRAREGHYIREMCTLNTKVAGRTRKEREEDNNGYIKEITKQYR